VTAKWITADLHLGHNSILRHCNRPFKDVKEMDECLITNWNARVKDGDLVYVVGDMVWPREEYTYRKYMKALNGTKILIKGNHDNTKVLKKVNGVYAKVTTREIIKCGEHIIVADHFPLYHWDRSHFNAYHVHGHNHGNIRDIYDNTGKILDVGVDTNNFFPYHIDEVLEIMETKPNNCNFLPMELRHQKG
jgi:calcineurin-like phosphoesterase family protein